MNDESASGAQPPTVSADNLLPPQRATLAAIRVPPAERPTYSADFADNLRSHAETELGGLVDAARSIDDRGLWISKRQLAGVFGCEARHIADSDAGFEWSVPTARGTVLHKAVELSVHSELSPLDAVNAAIERLIDGDERLGAFLAEASAGERADLVANCVALATRFGEAFPPMPSAWKPTAESRARVPLCDGAFVLNGKYDLTLGAPQPAESDGGGASGSQADRSRAGRSRAGKVIIDLKTGSRTPTDPEDLRFYALIETLSMGVPPLGIGSFYVAEGRIEHEPVTSDVLASAMRRTVDGIGRLIELESGQREPKRSPGPACQWCPISADCGPGQAWLAERDD